MAKGLVVVLLIAFAIAGCAGAGDYCGSGFVSATGRNWTLSGNTTFSLEEEEGSYDYYLNLCDQEASVCGGDSALCQQDLSLNGQFKSLGSQFNASISDVADATLVVTFGNGDFCPAYNVNRSVSINFLCQPPGVNGSFVNVTETAAKCVYVAYVNVPSTQCAGSPIATVATTATTTTVTTTTASPTTTTTGLTSGTSTSSPTSGTTTANASTTTTTTPTYSGTTTATTSTTTTSGATVLHASILAGLAFAIFALF